MWGTSDAHRGHSCHIPSRDDQSSSEYSSPDLQDNDSPLTPIPPASRVGAAQNSDSFVDEPVVDQNENLRKLPKSWRPSYSPEEEAYATSENSDEVEHGSNHVTRRNADGFIDDHSGGSIKGRRGKKGLTHAEMAIMGCRAPETEMGTDDTANDEDADENGMAIDQDRNDVEDDSGETEEEAEHYEERSRRSPDKERTRQRRSLWSDCHPVVLDAMKVLQARGADPTELGYARLAGAGKGAVDYIVRKQAITIGRSASLADCAIKSDGRHISRKHARLYWKTEGNEWVIRCLSEKNGIVVNGVPVVPGSECISVKSRDLIEVGDVAFFFLAATSPVVHVKNIPVLERTIRAIQEEEDREQSGYEDHERGSTRTVRGRFRFPHKSSKHTSGNERKKSMYDPNRVRLDVERLERVSGSKKRTLSMVSGDTDEPELRQRSRKRWKHAQKSRPREGKMDRADIRESDDDERIAVDDADVTEEEQGGEQKPGVWLDERPDGPSAITGVKQPLQHQQGLMSSQNRRWKMALSARMGDDAGHEQSSKHKEDWNKKERTDFGRALFAVGVDPIFEQDGSVALYDWSRFRKIAELPKKSDLMLEDYYIRMMADVHSLLEEEEREKRTKGPRTKHKPGCDCVVCENTRKSRRKKREEREHSVADDGPDGDSDGEEETDVKSTAKSSDKLVGLVTAQKLRVRLSIHEAARQVMSGAGKAVFEKLREQPARDFPSWWRSGQHDRALMRGTAIHGVAQWSDIWNDRRQKAFRKQKERYGDSVVWPSNQAAMKRVRELSSAINAELRREAKRAAKGEQDLSSRDKRVKPKSASKKGTTIRYEKPFSRRRKPARATDLSADEYDDVASQGADHDSGESTVESGSEDGAVEGQIGSELLTEDDDVLEVEVEEEMEVEDEDGDGEETEEESTEAAGLVGHAEKKQATGAADVSTDEEEDDEDNIQYETASDSGSD